MIDEATTTDPETPAGVTPDELAGLREQLGRVEKENGDRRAPRCPAGEGMLDPVLEQGPVGQARQGIVECLVEQLVFELPVYAYVPRVEHETLDARLVDQVGDAGLDKAVMVGVADLQLRDNRLEWTLQRQA